MALTLIPCPVCGCHAKIAETACPSCGAELRRKDGTLPRTAAAVMLGLTAAGAVACAGSGAFIGAGSGSGETSATVGESTGVGAVAYGVACTNPECDPSGTGGVGNLPPAQTVCDVAASANAADPRCEGCVGQAGDTPEPSGCKAADTACVEDASCLAAATCLADCAPDAALDACVETCIGASVTLQALLRCELGVCATVCGRAMPLACDVGGGGAGGAGGGAGAGAGGAGGTGGS